jgi:hypothetical protein
MALTSSLGLAQTSGTATETKTFEVIAVEGNKLVVKLPEGTRELTVPDDFQFTVNGQPMSVQQLKPGMSGTATITTRTTVTPVTVTEVKNGTVVQASGASIIVRTDEGMKMFTQGDVDKRGIKIMRMGQPAKISDFHSGDQLSATIITSMPPKVVTQKEVDATLAASGTGAASSPAPAARAPAASPAPSSMSASANTTMPPPAAGSAAPARRLPKTASPLPLVGLTGLVSLAGALALAIRRRRLAR